MRLLIFFSVFTVFSVTYHPKLSSNLAPAYEVIVCAHAISPFGVANYVIQSFKSNHNLNMLKKMMLSFPCMSFETTKT